MRDAVDAVLENFEINDLEMTRLPPVFKDEFLDTEFIPDSLIHKPCQTGKQSKIRKIRSGILTASFD